MGRAANAGGTDAGRSVRASCWKGFLLAAIAAWPLATFAQAAADQASLPNSLAEVLVTGERPGPGLWRVTNGEHVLWILGTLSPLPEGMTWRSREVEATLGRAGEVILPESVRVKLGVFRTLRYLPSLLRARRNPNGGTLKGVLPPVLYARWVALKAEYLGQDKGVERLRPMFAAMTLYARALADSDLTTKDAVMDQVRTLARRHRLILVSPDVRFNIKDPKKLIQEFDQTPPEAERACMSETVERLETDLPNMKLRADAWAVGDLKTLQRLRPPGRESVCIEAFTSAPGVKEQFSLLARQARDEWLREVKSALDRYAETFAVVPIADLLAPDGRLAQLRAQGYSVDPPR